MRFFKTKMENIVSTKIKWKILGKHLFGEFILITLDIKQIL